jgi:hypothetical protein
LLCGRDRPTRSISLQPSLAPLVWFAVAGSFFGQQKQPRDWTLRGFLAAQGSPVGLDIPEDKATREALGRAARQLFAEPIENLKGRRLDAAASQSTTPSTLSSTQCQRAHRRSARAPAP